MKRDQKKKKDIFLQGNWSANEEMVHKENVNKKIWHRDKWQINKIKILYSDVDDLISESMEIKDILAVKKPEIFCLTEAKLN